MPSGSWRRTLAWHPLDAVCAAVVQHVGTRSALGVRPGRDCSRALKFYLSVKLGVHVSPWIGLNSLLMS